MYVNILYQRRASLITKKKKTFITLATFATIEVY